MKKIVIFGLLGRGGNLYYTACLANACSKKYETYAVIPTYSDKKVFSNKVKLLTLEAPPEIVGTAKNFFNSKQHRELIDKIKRINPDVIHFNHNHIFYLLYADKLKNKFPIYWTYHDPQLHSGDISIKSLGDIIIHKKFEKISDRIFVHGKSWKKFLVDKRKLSPEKIKAIMHGTFDLVSKYGDKNKKSKKDQFMFFGRIVKYKGIDTLLLAMHEVVKKNKNAKLIIAGSGDFAPYKQLLTKDIEKNVVVENRFIPDEELADMFRESEFLVLPYDDATQSGVIPIAYSFKKPVIASNVGALPDVVISGKTGFLINPKDSKTLAVLINQMLEDKKKTIKMGEQSYLWMKKELDWDKIVKNSYS